MLMTDSNLENYVDIDHIFADECESMFEHRGMATILNDGRIINFIDASMEEPIPMTLRDAIRKGWGI